MDCLKHMRSNLKTTFYVRTYVCHIKRLSCSRLSRVSSIPHIQSQIDDNSDQFTTQISFAPSLFLFKVSQPVRRFCIWSTVNNTYYDILMMAAILANLIYLAQDSTSIPAEFVVIQSSQCDEIQRCIAAC